MLMTSIFWNLKSSGRVPDVCSLSRALLCCHCVDPIIQIEMYMFTLQESVSNRLASYMLFADESEQVTLANAFVSVQLRLQWGQH